MLEPDGPLDGLLHPNLRMQARVLDVGEQQVAEAWAHVRDMVEGLGLALGVRAELPAVAVTADAARASSNQGARAHTT